MGQAVGIVPAPTETAAAARPRPVAGDVGAPAVGVTDPGPSPADLRLVIEADELHGGFIYKTLDRRTGEVVNQFPRETLLRIMAEEDYTAGDIVTARV